MRSIGFAALCLGLLGAPAIAAPAPPAPIVFFDIAGPDLTSQSDFYKAIFGWQVGPNGSFSVPTTNPLPGNLRVERPTQGPLAERVLYVGVPDINATLAKITALGGSVVFPRTEVPGVVVLSLFQDPAGNRMGLVEMDGDAPKVPKGR
jgi:predicted enzyme related to lactoylglutathione lyase